MKVHSCIFKLSMGPFLKKKPSDKTTKDKCHGQRENVFKSKIFYLKFCIPI